MDYEDLEKVNNELKTVDIKGKAYVQVNTRIIAFRKLFPNGCIKTDIISHENGVVVMKATVTDEDGVVLGTGMAYEKESSSFINNTSYIENCETSAVGRALAMLGIGTDVSMHSADELANALINQSLKKEIGKKEGLILEKTLEDAGLIEYVCQCYKVKELSELTGEQKTQLMMNLDTAKEKYKAKNGN